MTDILTTSDAARMLGVSKSRVRAIALKRGVGHKITSRLRVFSPTDLLLLRPGKNGRPKNKLTKNEIERIEAAAVVGLWSAIAKNL